ncbi:benzoate 4-monooxygenase cytochrome P450 [Aureobasidium pullulans]|uniref:Benzoate 4-monooxygenase cytochrome P450 n=1 Tax=Aureobasidium pullulans TaxID=5580 RepID=A0A4S9X2G1_AURPU|nr:benzoate 4-monooxygenase cytochrome P450 [Aureobasidium pullulans]THZ72905.1 benzoate 4-monooxygenase cytochrome P450 [Aureobasidium pullulans]
MSLKHDSGLLATIIEKSLLHASNITFAGLILTCLALYLSFVAWDVFLGPLSDIPGPKLWAASYFPKAYMMWTGSEHETLQRLHETYGPVVRITPRGINYTDAAAWKDIYGHRTGGKTKTFEKDPTLYINDPTGETHILIANDADHTRHRRILANSFSDKALRDQAPLLKQWANTMVRKLKEVATLDKGVDMVAYYNFTTFDIMSDLTFGEPLYMLENFEYNPWVKLIFGSMKIIGKITAIKQIPNMPRIIIALMPKSVRQKGKKHQKFSSDRVDRRLARDPGRPDLWTEVLKRSGDLSDTIAGMSLSEMHANAGVFMTGGTETIATLLSGLTYYLLINPDKLARLVAEVRSTFTAESEITVDELARLPYLNACIEEGLRIYPPTPASLPRRVPQEGEFIAGKWIPGDVSVAISQWATNRHTVNFRDSASFIPERFLGDTKYASDNFAAFQPFSTGPRNCIGKNLAYHEIRLLLTMTLWNFDLSLEAESKDWSNQRLFIFWEKKPLMVKLKAVRVCDDA